MFRFKVCHLLLQFFLNSSNGSFHIFRIGCIVGIRINTYVIPQPQHLTGYNVDLGNAVYLIAKHFYTNGPLTGTGRQNLDGISPYPEGAAMKIHIVALILNIHQFAQNLVTIVFQPHTQRKSLFPVFLRRTQTVNARYTGYDNHIAPFQKRSRCRVPHFFDFLVNLGIFFYIGISGCHIGFRLIIIVVGYEILYRIFRKKFFEFTVQLSCQRFIVGNHQCRAVGLRNDVRHRKCFPRTGYPQHNLFWIARIQPVHKLCNSFWLVAGRFIFGYKFKIRHSVTSNHNSNDMIPVFLFFQTVSGRILSKYEDMFW